MEFSSENRPLKRRKSKNVKLSKKGNPTSRPFLSRVFGMLTTLLITLGLVGIVIFLRKTLPDGSKPSYADSSTLQARKEEIHQDKIVERQASLFTLGPVFTIRPPILPGDFPIVSSTVGCTTVMVPARNVKRQGYWHTYCSTSYFTITRTPTPTFTRGPLFTLTPTRIFTFRLPSGSPVVDCTTYFIPDKMKRGEVVECTTRYVPITTSSIPRITTSTTSIPITSTTTTTPPASVTSTSTTAAIESTTISPQPTITPTTTTTITAIEDVSSISLPPADPCITTWVDCYDRIEGECLTYTLTLSDCLSTSSEPMTTTTAMITSTTAPPIIDNCLATSISCTTIPIVLARGLKRADMVDCVTSFSTLEECISTSTTTVSTSSSPTSTSDILTSFTSITGSSSTTTLDETTPPSTDQTISIQVSTDSSTTPTTIPETTPITTPETTSTIPGTTRETAPETASETAPETTPETAPETTPETAPETTPETAPETTPGTTSESTPETTLTETIFSVSTAAAPTETAPTETAPTETAPTRPTTTPTTSPTTSPRTTLTPTTPMTSITLSGGTPSTTPTVTIFSSVASLTILSGPDPTTLTNVLIPDVSTSLQTESNSGTELASSTFSVSTGSLTQNLQTSGPTSTETQTATETDTNSFVIVQVSTVLETDPATSAVTMTGSWSSAVTRPPSSDLETEEMTILSSTSSASQESVTLTGSASPVSASPVMSPTRSHSYSTAASTKSVPDTTRLSSLRSNTQQPSDTSTKGPTPIAQTDETATGSATIGSGNTATPSSNPETGAPALITWPYWKVTESLTGNHAPLIVGRGFMLMMGAFYQQAITHDPVRQLTSGGISATELVSPQWGASQFGLFVAQIGTIFVAGGTYVDTNYCNDPASAPDNLNPCPPRVSGNPWVLDIIITVLVLQAGVVAYTMSKWFQKPGRLSADPTTIAGVAAVMGHPEIERQFSAFGGEITQQELIRALQGQEFKLGTFETEGGITKYGIMPVALYERKDRNKRGWWTRTRDSVRSGFNRVMFFRNWKLNRLFLDVVFGVLLLALLGLTVASLANIDQPQRVFLPTAVASGVGMKILFAFLGVLISSNWGRLFQDTQTFSPYLLLRDGEARPNPTILLNRHSSPICAFLPLLRNRHLAAASVAFTGIIAEFLIIALAGLPYRPGQLRSEFLFCGIASAIILCVMLAQLTLVIIWRRKLPHLPRQPDTIAAVMTYVAGTSMVRDFYGLEDMKTRERNKAIIDMGKVYAYGWRQQPEGGIRWIVDEVPDAERKGFLSGTKTSAESSAGGRGWYRPRGQDWRRDV